MPIPEVPGFIPKKLAAQRYNRSFRQLTRDLALAMQAKDEKILGHFKLILEEGGEIPGIDVTTERITTLRDDGRNPMWFIEEDWMAATYGPKSDQPKQTPTLQVGQVQEDQGEEVVSQRKGCLVLTSPLSIKDAQPLGHLRHVFWGYSLVGKFCLCYW